MKQLLDLLAIRIDDKGERPSGQLSLNSFWRAVCSNLTLVEQQNAVSHIVRLLQIVGGEQNRLALIGKLAYRLPE